MGLRDFFWRLFLVVAGVLVGNALVTVLVVMWQRSQGSDSLLPVLVVGVLFAALGAAAAWLAARSITAPLAALVREARAAVPEPAADDPAPPAAELGVLADAFQRMQRNLAQRLMQIEQNHQRLAAVLGNMAEGVLAVGTDRTVLLANEASGRLLELVTPQPIGRSLVEITRLRPVLEAVTQALDGQEAVTTEFDSPGRVRRRLGLRATRLPGSPCPGVVLVLHDMTELRRLESLRREFVANVSHELKTPLAAIKGYAETLRLGAVHDPEHNLHFVRRIEEQADRLHQLILDILQVARIESGQEAFELRSVLIGAIVADCAAQFAETAAARQIALTTEVACPEAAVWADEEGLRTIVNNLVDNALKYTPAGGQVIIRASAAGSHVRLEVEDTGIGIDEKDQARIFERFYRVDKARSREGGTGLGLSIVKHLALAFGGTVSVVSQPDRGSTFRVELPLHGG